MMRPVYTHRPSKDVTRRIFVDMLHHLNAVLDIRNYQYVGFGALDFIDFDAVHRSLGISEMYSIENDTNWARYEANIPYQCVRLLAGNSTDMLTRIDWKKLSVVWLDYEDSLNARVINDVEYLCQKLIPGSVLAVTLNAEPGSLKGRRDRMAVNVTEERIPPGYDDDQLGDWGWATAQQRILFSTIRRRLQKRPDSAAWWQTLNIRYRDIAHMQLVAGVIDAPVVHPLLESARLSRADYFTPDSIAVEVEIPYLTQHEQRLLRRKLPMVPRQRLPILPGVPREDIETFRRYYQWIGA